MWAVIKKEFKSYFYTPIGYIFIGVFLIAFSISFYFSVLGYGNVNFEYIYYTLPTILVLAFIIPLLTMRSFSEERKTGTEQINTKFIINKCLKDGTIVNSYKTERECALSCGDISKQAHIHECINGSRKSAYGFLWRKDIEPL